MKEILLIVSGPAGIGKNTVCDRLIDTEKNLVRAITSTSRQPRPYEKNGVDYNFLSESEFKKGIENSSFYEWAKVHGKYYGTSKDSVLSNLDNGNNVILIIDVQGAKTWREIAKLDDRIGKAMYSVFIKPESLSTLRERMMIRGDSNQDIDNRIETACNELKWEKYFDESFISRSREEDFLSLKNIYEKLK